MSKTLEISSSLSRSFIRLLLEAAILIAEDIECTVFEIIVESSCCQEAGGATEEKNADYVTVLIPKSYLVILKRY